MKKNAIIFLLLIISVSTFSNELRVGVNDNGIAVRYGISEFYSVEIRAKSLKWMHVSDGISNTSYINMSLEYIPCVLRIFENDELKYNFVVSYAPFRIDDVLNQIYTFAFPEIEYRLCESIVVNFIPIKFEWNMTKNKLTANALFSLNNISLYWSF